MPRYIYDRVADVAVPAVEMEGVWLEPPCVQYNRRMKGLAEMAGRCATDFKYGREKAIPDTTSIAGPNGFELTLVDSLHQRVNGDFAAVRQDFSKLTERILRDPFGETCIDTSKDTDAGQWARLVHRVEGPIADLMPGKRLAIKGTGLNMKDARTYLEAGARTRAKLTDQFRSTLELSRLQKERAPQGIGGLVMVNEVYGVLRHMDDSGQPREWMLMEQVEGTPVENIQIALATVRRRGGTEFGFRASDHPELAQFAGGIWGAQREYSTFSSLRRELNRELELPDFSFDSFGDLHGANLFQHDAPDGGVRYTAIDIDPR